MTIKTRNIANAAVTTAKLAANAVSAATLSATLATGSISLPLMEWRDASVTANQVGVIAVGGLGTAGSGGILGSDGATAATLKRRNLATDKSIELFWTNGIVTEVHQHIMLPIDVDFTASVVFKMRARMAGVTDVPTVAVGFWQNGAVGAYVASTNQGGNTAAVTGTSIAEYTFAVVSANLVAGSRNVTLTLVPAAHATDILIVSSTWLEYTRK